MNFIKSIILDFISLIDEATSDPVVKLLVIGIVALIVIIIISLIIKLLKQVFHILFSPFRRKKKEKRKNKKSSKVEQDQDKQAHQKNVLPDQHLQESQKLLSILDGFDTNLSSFLPPQDILTPIAVDSNRSTYDPDTLDCLDCNPTEEETQQISQMLNGLSMSELREFLENAKTSAQTVEASLAADQKKYLNLVKDRKSLQKSEKSAAEKFNQEISKAKPEIDGYEQKLKASVQNLLFSKEILSKLIDSEKEALAALQEIRSHIIEELSKTKSVIVEHQTLTEHVLFKAKKIDELLTNSKLSADKCISEMNRNDEELRLVVNTVLNAKRKVALNQKQIQLATLAYEQKQTEEAERLAREEAEKKAAEEAARKAEEERKAAEEAARKAEAERLAQEERKRAAEEKERLAQTEAERMAKEKAHQEAISHVQTDNREELQHSDPLIASRETLSEHNNVRFSDLSRPLTPEEEAAQAKAMMEAQRERRRQAALKKLQEKEPSISNNGEKSANKPDEPNISSSEKESTLPPTSTSNDSSSDSSSDIDQLETHEKTDELPEDPMAAIKAEWAKEREHKEKFAAEQEAREAEIARRVAEMNAENKKTHSSGKPSNT